MASSKAVYIKRVCVEGDAMPVACRVRSYCVKPIKMDRLYYSTEEEYTAKCTAHTNCNGHLYKTPYGVVLYPGTFCNVTALMRDEIYVLSSRYMSDRSVGAQQRYSASLASHLYTKRSILRYKCLGGNIEGSLRMVIVPCWEIEQNEVCISRHALSQVLVPVYYERLGALPSFKYEYVNEGDYAIGVRPPVLWAGNVQPLRVRLWDRPCIGLSPHNCHEYHGDFDGDELQLYFIKHRASALECMKWTLTSTPQFSMDRIREDNPGLTSCVETTFMESTTMCTSSVLRRDPVNYTMRISKVKQQNFPMYDEILRSCVDPEAFYVASVKGISDIIKQQLTQGNVGMITRTARVGYSEFVTPVEGTSYPISNAPHDSDIIEQCVMPGLPCMRLISKLGASVQQSLLDSHRAQQGKASRFDLALSVIEGSTETVVISTGRLSEASWSAKLDDKYVSIVDVSRISDLSLVCATYSPALLSKITDDTRYQVALRAVRFISTYYHLSTDAIETSALASALCYECDSSIYPSSNSNGCSTRHYKWLTKVLSKSWSVFRDQLETVTKQHSIDTMAECHLFANFDGFPGL